MTLENKNILLIEANEFVYPFKKELERQKAKMAYGGDQVPPDLARYLEENHYDGAIVHDYSRDGIREVIEAHRFGKRIVFMTRAPIWDTDKVYSQALKAARVPRTDRSLGSNKFVKEAIGQLDGLIN